MPQNRAPRLGAPASLPPRRGDLGPPERVLRGARATSCGAMLLQRRVCEPATGTQPERRGQRVVPAELATGIGGREQELHVQREIFNFFWNQSCTLAVVLAGTPRSDRARARRRSEA